MRKVYRRRRRANCGNGHCCCRAGGRIARRHQHRRRTIVAFGCNRALDQMSERESYTLRTQPSLDIDERALHEITTQATQLVAEYFNTISERPVRAENYAGKTTAALDLELPLEGVPLDRLMNECRSLFDLSRHNG